jgi:hypothetical protein
MGKHQMMAKHRRKVDADADAWPLGTVRGLAAIAAQFGLVWSGLVWSRQAGKLT